MKTKYKPLSVLLGILSLVLYACSPAENSNGPAGCEDNGNPLVFCENRAVVLSIYEDSLTALGAVFRMENHDTFAISFGKAFHLQRLDDGMWNYFQKGDYAFDLPLYEVPPGETYPVHVDWSNFFGELPVGTYRLLKEIEISSTSELFHVACEFSITESIPTEERNEEWPWTCGGGSLVFRKDDAVILSIQEESLTTEGATFLVENRSASAIHISLPFFLQRQTDGIWHYFHQRDFWFLTQMPILTVCPPGEYRLMKIDWTNCNGTLEAGTYRLLKEVVLPSTSEVFHVACEFVII